MLFRCWIDRIKTFCSILLICKDISPIRWIKFLFRRKNTATITTREIIISASSPWGGGGGGDKLPYVGLYCWFSHDVTKNQTKKLSILPRFYFHDVLEQLKTNFHTNFLFKRVLGFVIEYAWISKLLRDAAFTWRPRELPGRAVM